MRLTRRVLLGSVIVGAGTGLVAACSTPAPPQSAPPATAAPQAQQTPPPQPTVAPKPTAAPQATSAPRPGGTLRVGILGDIPNLDPHQLTVPVPDVTYSIWDRLLTYDDKVRPHPLLAESFEMSSDGKQLKLTVRKGVQFHTGRELTAGDVVWTLNRLKTDPVVAVTGFYTQIGPMVSVEAVDKYSLVLKSDNPWPGVYDLLVLMSVVDPETMQGPNAKKQPVGTGPFTFGEWVQGDHIRLIKNRNYWMSARPYVDEIVLQIYNDPQAMITAFEAGAIDIANKPPLVDAARLQNDPNYQVLVAATNGTRLTLTFNVAAPPADNQKYRQAVLYALDRQRIVESVLKGFGAPANLPFAPSSPAYDSSRDKTYTFDLDKAQMLLKSSGVTEPSMDFNYSSVSPEWSGIAQVYQADLAHIGVALHLKPVDPVTLNAELRSHNFTGLITGQTPLGQFSPTQQAFNPNYSPVVSFSGFKSDTLTQLADALQHEMDPAKQKDVYARWSDYVLDQVWATQVVSLPPVAAVSQKTHGLSYSPAEWLDYTNVWKDAASG